MADELAPPRKSVELEDPGAHNLDVSDSSSDQFTDASEGRRRGNSVASVASNRSGKSPIPITRVERLDDEPAYGEVPGTAAYNVRTQDAVPDEVEIISRSRSASRADLGDRPSNTHSPKVPLIVATKIDPDEPSFGEVPGTDAYDKRRADAVPDVILKSPADGRASPNPFQDEKGSPTSASDYRSPAAPGSPSRSDHQGVDADDEHEEGDDDEEEEEEEGEGFGDDFDDFEEGQEAEDDDFGEFDDGFAAEGLEDGSSRQPPVASSSTIPIPSIDWSEIDNMDDLNEAIQPYMNKLFPDAANLSSQSAPELPPSKFLSDRSLSLYSQLVAPPPLAPPDWLRSRIRRLFLVSLGVPVDLDEILPASKQKKLILPSIHLSSDRSPRGSIDSRGANGAISRIKGQNDSSMSLDSSGNRRSKRRKDEEREPDFDISQALRVSGTTESRLQGMDDSELKEHVALVIRLEARGQEALEYWSKRKEGAIKEKEAFEGVIENLVKHARKSRR